MLLYALSEKRSYAWLLTPGGLASAPLPDKDEIRKAVEQYRRTATQRVTALTLTSALAANQADAGKLYTLLVKPFESRFPSTVHRRLTSSQARPLRRADSPPPSVRAVPPTPGKTGRVPSGRSVIPFA